MRCLVVGSNGMAGHMVATYLRESGFDVIATTRKELDVENEAQVDKYLQDNEFDVVINCVGVLIQGCDNVKRAVYLNSYFPHYLKQRLRGTDTKIIHISTDCVFSGANGPYSENSPFDGDTIYDRSKALGEIYGDNNLTFRMSIIGPELKDGFGLFNWFMHQNEPISGYTNAIWSGITTLALAKAIRAAIEQDLTGLYHLTPKEPISKYGLLKLINDVFSKGLEITPKEASKSTNKILINNRIDFNYSVPDYDTMIRELREWMVGRKHMYAQYENWL
jgi:dTDP-4-dehydrorhamnose reductase